MKDGKYMAKKRQSVTQKLQMELENYKKWLAQSEETIQKMREKGEESFLNSPTYIQMKEKIDFLEKCNKLSEIGRVNAEGRCKRFSELDRKLYEDNKTFLEHNGDSEYFIGIIECYKEINEVHKYKNEAKSLEGRIQGYKDIIVERDEEIKRLQSVIADLMYEQTTDTAISFDEIQQKEYDQVIREMNVYKNRLERETEDHQKEKDKSQKLEKEIQNLKLQLSEKINENEELQKKVTEWSTAILTPEKLMEIIEHNIEQEKQLKKVDEKKPGRPVTVTDTQKKLIRELHKNGHSIRAIAKQVGKSVGTVHRILNEQ